MLILPNYVFQEISRDEFQPKYVKNSIENFIKENLSLDPSDFLCGIEQISTYFYYNSHYTALNIEVLPDTLTWNILNSVRSPMSAKASGNLMLGLGRIKTYLGKSHLKKGYTFPVKTQTTDWSCGLHSLDNIFELSKPQELQEFTNNIVDTGDYKIFIYSLIATERIKFPKKSIQLSHSDEIFEAKEKGLENLKYLIEGETMTAAEKADTISRMNSMSELKGTIL